MVNITLENIFFVFWVYVLLSFPLVNQSYQQLYKNGKIEEDNIFLSISIVITSLPYVPLYYILIIKEFFVYLYKLVTYKRK